jgi:hypothetical protein
MSRCRGLTSTRRGVDSFGRRRMLSLLLSHHVAKRATCWPGRQTKRRRLHLGADCLSAWTPTTVKPRYFSNWSSFENTSSRTAGADLGSGHKIEPAQKKVVIASGLLPFLNDEAKALALDENLTILFWPLPEPRPATHERLVSDLV